MKTDNLKLENELFELDRLNKLLIDTARNSVETYALYAFDLYCTSIINRTLNLNRGYSSQIRSQNFISAAPLVRISLDSLLRLFAAFQVDYNIDTFANNIMNGQAIDKTKDKNGKLMKDFYLVELLSSQKECEWVKTIYKAGNAFVHFTSKHIFASVKSDKSQGKPILNATVQYGDSYIKVEEKLWATRAMIQITIKIIDILNFWIKYKESLVEKEEKNRTSP